jgi:hypothetical protein
LSLSFAIVQGWPNWNKWDVLSRADFAYDGECDAYVRPAEKQLQCRLMLARIAKHVEVPGPGGPHRPHHSYDAPFPRRVKHGLVRLRLDFA